MTKDQGAQEPIRLELGATAEPRTCGCCDYFERRDTSGYCNLRLPQHYAKVPYNPEVMAPNWVRDTNGCDLHKPDGKAYIVSRLVKP